MTRLRNERESITVKELIEALSRFGPNTQVYYADNTWALKPIEFIDDDETADDGFGNLSRPVVLS